MRLFGALLVLVGILTSFAGAFFGFSTVLNGSGRHPIAVHELAIGKPLHATLPVKQGRRYSVGIDVTFDRAGLEERDGALAVRARMPLVATVRDAAGTKGAEIVGWLDPSEPPTVLFGAAVPRGSGPAAGEASLHAERLVGPWLVSSDQALTLDVDLGPDRLAEEKEHRPARPVSARVILYDDALPATVALPFGVAGLGVVTALLGLGVLARGLLREVFRRKKARAAFA